MRIVIHLCMLFNLLVGSSCHAAIPEQSLSVMRKTFLQAEQYIVQDRESDFFALADTLKDYPLYPYLQYQWLSKHLQDTNTVLTFLHDHTASRYTPLLHSKWLVYLGQNQNWPTVIQYYKNSQDSELQCYFGLAQYQIGEQKAALETAKPLWLSGKLQPPACDELFQILQASSEINPELIWQRFQNVLEQNNPQLAAQILPLLSATLRSRAEIWLKLHEQPKLAAQAASWKQTDPQAGLLFAHTIMRWLNTDMEAALQTWDKEKSTFQIPADIVAETEKRLAMELAFRRDSRAYPRLSIYAGSDQAAQEWRVRAALSQQDWRSVIAALADLNQTQKLEDKWQYWLARALAQTGQTQEAAIIYQIIAKNRSFYAFLAAEKLQQPIALNHRPLEVSAQAIEQLQQQHEFMAVKELLAIDRRAEATRQWWHATAELDTQQLEAAAKLAQQMDWPSIAIFTLAKANNWDDMELRFPLQYSTLTQDSATVQALDPALLYALIRQESAFDPYAGSTAGAIGLMQLMPRTAKQIAGEINQSWNNDFNLLNPQINIKFGSYYFKKILNQFDGNIVLATAAYNAGPLKIKSWRPKSQTLPADIWIETIPYKETRGYVSSVIMYTLIYQQRLNRNNLKATDLLLEIKPG